MSLSWIKLCVFVHLLTPQNGEASDDEAVMCRTQLVWHSRLNPHASLVWSSNSTSAFSNHYLSNLWHYKELLPAVDVFTLSHRALVFPWHEKKTSASYIKKQLSDAILSGTNPSLLPAGCTTGQLMKAWSEQSCFSRGRRRCSGSRPTWPAGCPGPTSTPQMTPWSHIAPPCSTFETPSSPLLYHFANPRFFALNSRICFKWWSVFITSCVNCEAHFSCLGPIYKHTQMTRATTGNSKKTSFELWELPTSTVWLSIAWSLFIPGYLMMDVQF